MSLGPTTTLVEIVRQLDGLDENLAIFMRRPASATAECLVGALTEQLLMPADVKAAGYLYFLDIRAVHDVLDFLEQSPRHPATEDEKVRALLYYDEHDTWPDWVAEPR